MRAKQRLPLIAAVVSLVTAALILPNLVGETARLVDLIALFASGVGAGAALVAALHQSRGRPTNSASLGDA